MHKNITLVVGITILFLGNCITPSVAIDNPIKPISTGNTLYVGGTGEGNYSKIQEAISKANPGDIVFVYDDSSPYYENIVVDKSISLVGENKNSTLIDGNEIGNCINVSADWVNISGFSIQNSGYETGIKIISNHNTVFNNNLLKNEVGILLTKSNYNTLNGNAIGPNEDAGIEIRNSNNNTLSTNKIFRNKYFGIIVHNSNENIITSNEVYENSLHGISIQNGSYNRLIANTIYGHNFISSTWGITLSKENYGNIISENNITNNWGGIDYLGVNSEISKNDITNNSYSGIYLNSTGSLPCNKNIVTQNNIFNNDYGVIVFWADRNTIEFNNIQKNKLGMVLEKSRRNLIKINNFILNENQAFFKSSWINSWYSNYWDDWLGLKSNLSIIQKLPKVIISNYPPFLNFDWHPAKEPYDI